jgi:hypothetical protein
VSTSPEATGTPTETAGTRPEPVGVTVPDTAVPAVVSGATNAAPAATHVAESARCANCGGAVPGKYCGNCGQNIHNPVQSAWHFVGEATEDLTHADSRLWRTLLALLLKPGFLTREFIEGRRTSYLPPLRLYLVLSVLFFLLAASSRSSVGFIGIGVQQSDGGPAHLVVSSIDRNRPGETAEQRQARICGAIQIHSLWKAATLERALRNACVRSLGDNGESFQEAFFHALPRAMFAFLPLLAAVMTLLYRRPRHYYIEHLLLLLHNHAFVFLAAIIALLLRKVVPASLSTSRVFASLILAIQIYIALYIYLSMRRMYGQGPGLTLAKFVIMNGAYLVSAILMLALTFAVSVLSL